MSLVAVSIKDTEFTKEEHETTYILLENETVEQKINHSLRDFYEKPYVVKMFKQNGDIEYYRIQRS